jgi:protein-tyrosine-phosphatase
MMAERRANGPFRVLYLCSGNTCRSPMAEGVLRKLVEDLGESAPPIESLSAGTLGIVGSPAAHYSVDVSAEHGVDIRDHRSQAATRELLHAADLVLALATEHFHYALDLDLPSGKVYLVRGFPGHEGGPDRLSIPDPIGRPREAYEQVFFQIEEAIRRSLPTIIRLAQAKSAG